MTFGARRNGEFIYRPLEVAWTTQHNGAAEIELNRLGPVFHFSYQLVVHPEANHAFRTVADECDVMPVTKTVLGTEQIHVASGPSGPGYEPQSAPRLHPEGPVGAAGARLARQTMSGQGVLCQRLYPHLNGEALPGRERVN